MELKISEMQKIKNGNADFVSLTTSVPIGNLEDELKVLQKRLEKANEEVKKIQAEIDELQTILKKEITK